MKSTRFLEALLLCSLCLYLGRATAIKEQVHVTVVRGSAASGPTISKLPESEASKACASGWFEDMVETTGWGFLNVYSNPACPDLDQAYGAGYVEGVVTATRIWQHWQNTKDQFEVPPGVTAYLKENLAFVDKQMNIDHEDAVEASYWWQVRLVLEQVQGLQDGYESVAGSKRKLPENAIFLMNTDGDLYDLVPALSRGAPGVLSRKVAPGARIATDAPGGEAEDVQRSRRGRCSGIIKVLPNNEDMYISQVAFTGLEEMLRMFKHYNLGLHVQPGSSVRVPGWRAAFSSYPGHIYSGDDFYLLSSGVSAVETTIYTFNHELYKEYIRPEGSVLEWVRNVVANRLAVSAAAWTEIFARHNSGTYNNQWLVADWNLFEPGQPLRNDTVWILEQYPGYIARWDATEEVRKTQYFASYNNPASKELYDAAGWPEAVKKYGDFFDHEKAPRALIFARDQGKVKNIDDFKHLMRYNDFLHDPLGSCKLCNPHPNGEFGIASRGDLNPANGSYPFIYIGHRDHSSIDTKITSYLLHKSFTSLAVSGPTCDQHPPFSWKTSDFRNLPHQGHPETFKFPWFEITWDTHDSEPWVKLRHNSSACSNVFN